MRVNMITFGCEGSSTIKYEYEISQGGRMISCMGKKLEEVESRAGN